jgi:phage gpG-like protein
MQRLQILVFGDKVLTTKFTRFADDMLDASPGFDMVADLMLRASDKTFSSQGRHGGGSWKPLTGKWLRRKASKGWDTRILHKNGNLRDSVTKRGADGQILDIGPNSINFGSDLPYAARHQFGYRQTPKRPFVKMTPLDIIKIRNILRDHMMQEWTRRGTGT